MFGPTDASHWAACAIFIAAAAWIGVMGIMWFMQTKERDWTVWLRAIGLLVIVFMLTPIMIYFSLSAGAQMPPGGVTGNCNNFGNNNFNCNTLNIGPSRTEFSDALGVQLLAHMSENKPVALQTIGSPADQKVGDNVQKYLENHGFNIRRITIGMLAPPPDHPFSFLDTPSQYVVIVAPSAH